MENLMLSISGMHCATCAQKIEKALSASKGVLSIAVNFSIENAAISFDEHIIDEKKIFRTIEKLGYTPEKITTENEKQIERKKMMNYWLKILIISGIFTASVLFGPLLISFIPSFPVSILNPLLLILTTVLLYISAHKILLNAFENIKKLQVNQDLLPGIALVILYLYSFILTILPQISPDVPRTLIYSTIALIIVILIAHKWYTLKSDAEIKENFETLLNLQPKKARIVRNETDMEIDADKVKVGDLIKVKAGETIPVDGIIIEGTTKVNEALLTGSIPLVEKKSGNEVLASSINMKDTILFKATQVGEGTTLSQVLHLLKDSKKYIGEIQKGAKKAQAIITIFILLLAALTFIFWIYRGEGIYLGILTSTALLLISYPIAFSFGTNSPINYGINKSASQGILFKGGMTIETICKVKRIILDKTGTLTKGIPEITNVIPKEAFNEKRFLILLGSLENASAHPFAEAIVEYCKTNNITLKKAFDFKSIEGQGIMGTVDGQEIIAGNLKLMEKSNVQMHEELLHKAEILSKNVRTPIYVSRNRELIGLVGIADTIKETAKEAIPKLPKLGYELTLVTGDNKKIAEHIAEEIRIKDVIADILQKEKIEAIQSFQEKKETVAFVGDGINDAPVLAQADIGIALGTGTDTALEASDITFISDDLNKINQAFKNASSINRIAKQNILLTAAYHIITLPIAAGVFFPFTKMIMHPAIASLLMGLFFLFISSKSMLLKKHLT